MKLDLRNFSNSDLDAAAKHYEERGYIFLEGLENSVVPHFRKVFCEQMGVSDEELSLVIEPENPEPIFPCETRKRVGRIDTPTELGQSLLGVLRTVLLRLIGPFTQVSSTFHGQFKGGAPQQVGYGGYTDDYMEVHRPYLLHQDFTGASLPTSPSAVTLWVSINTCSDWKVRFYPASHRQGLLCNDFLKLDDERLSALEEPIDVQAKLGTGVLFNALMLHGTCSPGPRRRVSCDIRFFPLCGFLPSTVNWLHEDPLSAIESGLTRAYGPTLESPLREAEVLLGQMRLQKNVPALSPLNWTNYLYHALRGELDQALHYLNELTNTTIGHDGPEVYARKFHGRPINVKALKRVAEHAGSRPPNFDLNNGGLFNQISVTV